MSFVVKAKSNGIRLHLEITDRGFFEEMVDQSMTRDDIVKRHKHEGRSINKLQNAVILLISRPLKFRNTHFVGDLILSTIYQFYYNDVTVTSFVDIRYGTVHRRSQTLRLGGP